MGKPLKALWEIYVKEESSYGIPATPSNTDVIEAFDITPPKRVVEPIYKAGDPRYLQENSAIYPGKEVVEFEFSTYMRMGVAGESPGPPRLARLIKSAAFSETDAGSYHLYEPSKDAASLTIYAQTDDGYEFQLAGARVSRMQILLAVGDLIVVRFTVRGLFIGESNSITSLTPSFEASSLVKCYGFTTNSAIMELWRNIEINVENTIYERIDPTNDKVVGGVYVAKQKITMSAEYELDADSLPNIETGDVAQIDLSISDTFAIHAEGYVENKEITETDGILTATVNYLMTGGSALKLTIYKE